MTDAAPLRLRAADADDARRLLEWRNDAATRLQSLTREEIDLPTHRAWLARRLADPDCALFIVEHGGRPVGQVRLDRSAFDVEVSVGLAAEVRGQGLGARSLRAAQAELSRWPEVTRLTAVVRKQNAPSLRLFAGFGFEEESSDHEVVHLVKRL